MGYLTPSGERMYWSIMVCIRNLAFLGAFLGLMAIGQCEELIYFEEPSFEEYVEFWDHVYERTPDEVDELWFKLHSMSYPEWRLTL